MKGKNSTYIPKIGERCLISGPNCDGENGYVFEEFDVLWGNDVFVLYGSPGYWPVVSKWDYIIAKPLPGNKSIQSD